MFNNLIAEKIAEGSITNPVVGSLGQNPDAVGFLQRALPVAITIILVVGAVVFFFMLITGAIKWISSGGDKQALESAKGTITSAIIGLVILFAVFAIIRLIQLVFGITILSIDIGKLIIR